MISVYPTNETKFLDNGIKILKPLKALIRKEDNGDYYININDSIDYIDYYKKDMIVKVPTPWGKQCFRFDNPTIENKKISIKGKHIYFDCRNYIIKDSYVVDKNCNDAIDHLKIACDKLLPFNLISDIESSNSYRCIRKTFEEAVIDVIEKWGGHLVRDNFNIEIRNNIGTDRGVTLAYAKNIKSIKAAENWDLVATKIMPVGKEGLLLDETYLSIDEELYNIPYTKIINFDQSNIVEDDYRDVEGNLKEEEYKLALINDLRTQGLIYLNENKIPKVNYSLSAYLKDISDIGDVIHVIHPKCKIDIVTNVIAIEYDVIADNYTKIEFGNFKNKLKDLISTITSNVSETVNTNINESVAKLENELSNATNDIVNMLGNSNVIYEGDKILVLDKLPKEEAKYVIMINAGGIGFSQTGVNGTFNSAWDITGTLNMQHINTINFVADLIKGGTLKLGSIDGESGKLELYNEANKLIILGDKDGITLFCENGEYVKLNPEVGFAGYDFNGNKIYWVDGDEFHMKKSVVEEEITIANKLRFISIENDTNNGIGIVAMV